MDDSPDKQKAYELPKLMAGPSLDKEINKEEEKSKEVEYIDNIKKQNPNDLPEIAEVEKSKDSKSYDYDFD